MIPKYARYKYCIDKSVEFILKEGIDTFPFDSDNIINKNKWARLKYEFLANKHHVSIEDVIEAYGSHDGYSIYNGRNYIIAYNNTHIPKRIYFTKLHEIGHIYLNHFLEFDETILTRTNITKDKYKVLENEANCFARNVIAPAILVKQLNLDTAEKIADYFQITPSCAKTRLDLLNDDLKYIDETSKKKQIEFFNRILNKKLCVNCKSILEHDFCKICGSFEYQWGDNDMIYSSIEIYENSKAKICPFCGNEHTNIAGEFCQICGNFITNKCTFCDAQLSGDARYCPFCGTESTFYQSNLLNNWKTENNNNESPLLELPF